MFRRVSTTVLATLMVVLCSSSSALAQPSIQPWVREIVEPLSGEYVLAKLGYTAREFRITITLDAGDHELESVEFSLTDLGWPYVVVTGVSFPNSNFENTAPEGSNQFRIEFNGCASPCEQREIATIRLLDIPAGVASNTHLELHGFGGPGTLPRGRLCGGEYVDVPMDGPIGMDGFGIPTAPGAVVLNWWGPCPLIGQYCGLAESRPVECDQVVSGLPGSITGLKARFAN